MNCLTLANMGGRLYICLQFETLIHWFTLIQNVRSKIKTILTIISIHQISRHPLSIPTYSQNGKTWGKDCLWCKVINWQECIFVGWSEKDSLPGVGKVWWSSDQFFAPHWYKWFIFFIFWNWHKNRGSSLLTN